MKVRDKEHPLRKPKYDYDTDEFFKSVEKMARAGLTDSEIASALNLTGPYFSNLKNGKVSTSPADVNAKRSEKIRHALSKGRTQITSALHATYLNAALGKIVTKQKIRKLQEVPCDCGGRNKACPDCGGTGVCVLPIGVVSETEVQQPPNMQALMNLLSIYTPGWKEDMSDAPDTADQGIDICKWIEQETIAKKDKEEKAGKEAAADDTDA